MANSLPVSDWWCCMSDAKRDAVFEVMSQFIGNPLTTPRVVIDFILASHDFTADRDSYQLWLDTFQVTFVGVVIDDVEVEFAVFDPDFWTTVVEYVVTFGHECPEPCYVLKFALSHL